jgi:hypothetical protein
VNEGVNVPPRGHISSLGTKFTPRGEVRPWGPGVKLRMALRPGDFSPIERLFTLGSLLKLTEVAHVLC